MQRIKLIKLKTVKRVLFLKEKQHYWSQSQEVIQSTSNSNKKQKNIFAVEPTMALIIHIKDVKINTLSRGWIIFALLVKGIVQAYNKVKLCTQVEW